MNLPTSLTLPTSLSKPQVPAQTQAPAPIPAPSPTPAPAPVAVAPSRPLLSPEELNDLRSKVLNGEPVDRELLRQARDQLRQRNSMSYMGVKKAKDADDLAGAVNSGVLDF
jgi:hypothetical protein